MRGYEHLDDEEPDVQEKRRGQSPKQRFGVRSKAPHTKISIDWKNKNEDRQK